MGNPSVFVSHSRYDEEMVNFFSKVTARIGVPTHFMELENMGNKQPGSRIADIIRSNSNIFENVQLLVVLLGRNLENPPTPTPQYTYSWVNYEVGVAAGCRKPVLILEEINTPVNFPVPYVTDYFQYQMNDVEDIQKIGEIVKKKLQHIRNLPDKPTCPYQNCNAKYNLWNRYSNRIHCPVCRQEILFEKQ